MAGGRVIFLPEIVVEDHLGKALPQSVGQEFEYNGQRYRVCQRDPLRPEAEVPCELIEPTPERKAKRKEPEKKRKGRR